MRLKSVIETGLRPFPPLYRMASRLYHNMNPEFRSLSPGAAAAIHEAFELSRTDRDAATFEGDYHEFGLFRGGTFFATWQTLETLGLDDVRMYGFDSFEGLPAATSIDAGDTRFFEGQYACSREEVERNLAENGMDLERAALIQGFYEDSLTEALKSEHAFRPASVVLLDCDYYTSTKVAMDWLTPYLRAGTILLFDDWFSYGDNEELGQQKALAEWLAKNRRIEVEHLRDFQSNGRGFILRNTAS
jgi:hypothetical protein